MSEKRLTHLDEQGAAHMVEIAQKPVSTRVAEATGTLLAKPETLALLTNGPKGDAIATARIAGIMAAKRTADLIPLCHPIQTTGIALQIEPHADAGCIQVTARITVVERTGAEMEALTAVTIALLALYDMLKSAQKDMRITDVRLIRKSGGTSGDVDLE
jgi:cyclic pyranopterin phosphate synthase